VYVCMYICVCVCVCTYVRIPVYRGRENFKLSTVSNEGHKQHFGTQYNNVCL